MEAKRLPKSVVIIGAGAAGLFTARRLRQLGVTDITLLEKEPVVGGKCSTYIDPHDPTLKMERGATVIAPNYGEVIDALREKGIKIERTLPSKSDSKDLFEFDKAKYFQKTQLLLQLLTEIRCFNKGVNDYRKCCKDFLPLPQDLELPFEQFAAKNGLKHIKLLLKPFLEGFGYGDMRDCPTYSVLEYMGYMTIPFLLFQHMGISSCELGSIEGGFQAFMEKLAGDFNVITSSHIHQIKRTHSQVTVDYTSGSSEVKSLHAETLVMAVSPRHWEALLSKENLTPIEQQCVEHLTYYKYPVVICQLRGFPLNYVYRPKMLYKENVDHVAFVSTLDKRENPLDGRLCSAYINRLELCNKNTQNQSDDVNLEAIKEELLLLPGVTGVKIIEYKIWDDYFPSLPWSVRVDLERQQHAAETRTLYVGSYTLGSFEDVACIANRATHVIDRTFGVPAPSLPLFNDIARFFYMDKIRINATQGF